MPEPLYMLKLILDRNRLFAHGKRRGFPMADPDVDFLVHAAFGELWEALAPQPFWIDTRHRTDPRRPCLSVLAYAGAGASSLREQAQRVAEPDLYRIPVWDDLLDKPMATEWQAGQRLGFQVRFCPVARSQRCREEVDAFLLRCRSDGPAVAVDRETVYRDWLAAFLVRRGGARLLCARLGQFRLGTVLRRTQGSERRARRLIRPDATLEGVLEVTDSAGFGELLRRGIGRHRSFGFGMLRLSAPERSEC